jgi:hypothetical protein
MSKSCRATIWNLDVNCQPYSSSVNKSCVENQGANLIWKFADQKVNGIGPAHIEKLHFKGICGCIYRQSLMKYGGNKVYKREQLF